MNLLLSNKNVVEVIRVSEVPRDLYRIVEIFYGNSISVGKAVEECLGKDCLNIKEECLGIKRTERPFVNYTGNNYILYYDSYILSYSDRIVCVNSSQLVSHLSRTSEVKNKKIVDLSNLKSESGNKEVLNDCLDRLSKLIQFIVDRRDEVSDFMKFALDYTQYFKAPASTKYHNNFEHGLLQHSINVAENALKLADTLAPELSKESIVICSLFHDFGKAGTSGIPMYLVKEPTEKQKKYGYSAYPPYEYNTSLKLYLSVPARALYWLSKYIDLTEEEWQTILIHDGQYVDDNKSYALKESKLSIIISMADRWTLFQEDVI